MNKERVSLDELKNVNLFSARTLKYPSEDQFQSYPDPPILSQSQLTLGPLTQRLHAGTIQTGPGCSCWAKSYHQSPLLGQV